MCSLVQTPSDTQHTWPGWQCWPVVRREGLHCCCTALRVGHTAGHLNALRGDANLQAASSSSSTRLYVKCGWPVRRFAVKQLRPQGLEMNNQPYAGPAAPCNTPNPSAVIIPPRPPPTHTAPPPPPHCSKVDTHLVGQLRPCIRRLELLTLPKVGLHKVKEGIIVGRRHTRVTHLRVLARRAKTTQVKSKGPAASAAGTRH